MSHGRLLPKPPSQPLCQCGELAHYRLKETSNATAYLEFGPPVPVTLHAYHSACGKEQCSIPYDGHDDGLLVCNKSTIFAARILYSYGNLYSIAGLSQEAFHQSHLADIEFRSSGNR
jgi:hypothetical protein